MGCENPGAQRERREPTACERREKLEHDENPEHGICGARSVRIQLLVRLVSDQMRKRATKWRQPIPGSLLNL